MSWLFPSVLAIAGLAAVTAIALHFISRTRPIAEPLPTARFVPPRPIRARTRSFAFSDLPLLLLRLAAIGAIGTAVAGPMFAGARDRVARVIVADRSRSVASAAEVRDSVRRVLRPGDALVAFDSAAVSVSSIDSLSRTETPGSLSAGLARAIRAAANLGATADSVELVLVSPFATGEVDAATDSIRASWHGRARVMRVAAASRRAAPPRVQLPLDDSDALVAGLSLMGVGARDGWIRLVHGTPTAADSAWASQADRVLLVWPHSGRDMQWAQRSAVDAIGGLTSATGTIVARFPRVWTLAGHVVARWSDGQPAAVENPIGRGCIRDVGVLIDPASDVTLRQSFRDFARALLAPCGGASSDSPVAPAQLASFAGQGSLAPVRELMSSRNQTSRWSPWLLLLGALLLTLELAVRRTERRRA